VGNLLSRRLRVAPAVVALAAAAWCAAAGVAAEGPAGDWYLALDHAAEAQALLPASLTPIRVAVLDSGIDGSHFALAGSIVAARSFVGGSPLLDTVGHGTYVAGEILATAAAAAADATRPSPVQLMVAKLVAANGTIALHAESRAIYWAVDNGARVINLSLAGLRDPAYPTLDTYSPAEAAAVRYAIAHRVVVVAAVGNGDSAPSEPWPHAGWPAALPHVIGVSAIAPDGSVPAFSNRDRIHDELAAPGTNIVSTFPSNLTAANPGCADQGYSDCGPSDYQSAQGTSFAAPQVSAAAATLLSVDPQLTPDQVSWLLERSADDANPGTGCAQCTYGRDRFTGWGTLDIAKAVTALAQPFPPASSYEPTNDAGSQARPLTGPKDTLTAVLDYWENPIDVYRVHLKVGDVLTAHLTATAPAMDLKLWRPGTIHVQGTPAQLARDRVAQSLAPSSDEQLHYQAAHPGWYYLEAALTAKTNTVYTLSFTIAPRSRQHSTTSRHEPARNARV
jgi:subtilisin family serine protease